MAKIYQLYYTRCGIQEKKAGWNIVANSKGIPETAKNNFKSHAANLLNTNPKIEGLSLAFDIQTIHDYVFLSHINYYSINENGETDSRGISFIHGFAMQKADYQELIREPEQFLAIQKDCIMLNYNGEKELPVLSAIPYTKLTPEPLLDKYHLKQDSFDNLMGCICWAMNSVGKSLTIIPESLHINELKNVSQEITFLILRYMPYSLRMKVSVFSGIRQGATLCFSDHIPTEGAWFCLETGEYECPNMPKYDFISYFGNIRLKGFLRDNILERQDHFINVTYGRKFENLEFRHVELSYHVSRPETLQKLSKENLDKYMEEALSDSNIVPNINYEMLDEYYAKLIEQYLQMDWTFSSQKFLNKLQKRYEATNCQYLKNVFVSYYVKHQCFVGAEQAYELLYDLETIRSEDFQDFFKEIKKHCPEFYNDYSLNYKLKRRIANYSDLMAVWEEKQKFLSIPEGKKLLDIMENLFKKEMAASDNNSQRYEICKRYEKFFNNLLLVYQNDSNSFIQTVNEEYWKYFRIQEFTYKNINEYRDMEALQKENPFVCEPVKRLLQVRESLLQEIDAADFQDIFFTDSVLLDENMRSRLVQELRQEAIDKKKISLDACLLLNFHSGQSFDLKQLAKDLEKISWIDSERDGRPVLYDAVNSSKVLKQGSKNENILKYALKKAVKTDRSDILQKLYQYYFPKTSGSDLDRHLLDIVQKWQLFLAISMTQILLAKYVMGVNPVLGKVTAAVGLTFTVIGLLVSMYFGNTNSFHIIHEGNNEVIRWMIFFIILSVISLASAIILSGTWINIIQGAVIVLLLTGRLCYGTIKTT